MANIDRITYFAQTDARNKLTPFGIKSSDRSKHVYVIGKTGMGKSTLLENMAIQDIQNGEGVVFIDPHGGTAEKLLDYVPEDRIKDVVYFAPFDMDYPVSFNIMEDVGADKRHLVVNGLMSIFEKIWEDAWSARMAYILQNTLLALLEFPGATLLAVNRMYADKEFRKQVVDNVTDISVKSFWVDEYAKYTDKYAQEATPAIQNKIGQFAGNPLIRNIIGQSKSSFDLRKIMDEKKILIVNLSKGRVGEGNARLLGSMLITKIYLAAMSRADENATTLAKLPNFYLYVDEFQSFADKSFADILSEARKYKLNLTIAHQYIEQMEEEVRDAVFGNVGTMIVFRVGAYDAEVLEKEFLPTFTQEDLVNLGLRQIYLKLMIDSVTSPPFSATTLPPIKLPENTYVKEIIENTRQIYSRPKAVVEKEIVEWHKIEKSEKPKVESQTEYKPQYNSEPRPYPTREKERERSRPEFHAPQPIDIRKKPEPVRQKPHFAEASRGKELPPLVPGDDFKPLKAISLEDLKKPNNNQRQPSQQNVSDLRSALSNIVTAGGGTSPKAMVKTPNPSLPPKTEHKPEQKNKKEPSAEELKALLETD